MWNKPTKKQLEKIPKLYSQDKNKNKKVYMKFFIGGWTWYVLEFDGTDTFFGFVISPYEPEGEYGYFSLSELSNINVNGIEVDRDKYSPTPSSPILLKTLLNE